MKQLRIKDYLARLELFDCLNKEECELLASISSINKYPKKSIIFYENDILTYIYVLIKGDIRLYKIDRFDNEIFLDTVKENSFIYTVSNLSYNNQQTGTFYNAQAMQDCEILQIDAEKFKALFLTKPQILQNFLNESFKTIMQLQYIINRDIIFDGMAKVAHMLCNDLDKFNKMKKQEIAYSLHLQPETLSRILKKLHKLDLIQTINNKIKIINFSDLQLIYQA